METGAHFATRRQVRRRLRRSSTAWFPLGYLPPWPRVLAVWQRFSRAMPPMPLRGPEVCLPSADLARHVLVTGLTGAHKTTALTLPVLVDAARAGVTAIAFDLKYGERDSLAAAAPEWWRRGRRVLAFAPLDGASLRWNPLASCRSFADAQEFAAHLFPDEPALGADGIYWTGAERGACAALVWALVSDGGGRSIARLRAMAEAGPGGVFAYVRRHPHSADVTSHLGAYSAMLPKDQAGILQGIASRLEAAADPRVARATEDALAPGSWDEIVLNCLRREPTLLLVGVPQAALPRLRTVAQLLMRTLAAEMLRPRARDERVPVIYVLEELPAWGAIPGLGDLLATFRSRDVAIVATVQSEAQGQAVYGTAGWAAVAANFVTKIYFPSLADPDAERLSRALGVTIVEHVSRSRGWTSHGRHDAEQRRMVEVPLRRPEALQGAGASRDEIILRCPGLAPARLWCPPFHERPAYARLVPETVPLTVEIAFRRRSGAGWTKRERTIARDAATRSGASVPETAPASTTDGPSRPCGAPGTPRGGPPKCATVRAAAADGNDGVALATLICAILDRGRGDGTDGPRDENGTGARIICRGNRLAEVRLDPWLAYGLLGGGEAAQAIVRRWAARGWVKHVRPVFVLERRALEALAADLQQRLVEMAPPRRR